MTSIDAIEEITRTLRPFPIIADRVLKLVRKEDVNFQELTQLISTDPSLTSLILGLSNSPIYGTIHRRIDSLHRAILLLGRDHVVEAVMVHIMRSVRESVQTAWPAGDIYFWQHSIGVGIVTRLLATHLHVPYVQQAFIVGLLHDIGKLLLLRHNPGSYSKILEQVEQFNTPLHVLEKEYFGITHAEAGRAAAAKWNLPDEFADTIAGHHNQPDVVTDSLSNLVRNANLITKIAGIGTGGNPFVATSNLSQLPHARLHWSTIQGIVNDLPEIVNELTGMIFGSSLVVHARVPKPSPKHKKDTVFVSILDKNEQLLVRYILTTLGFQTQGDVKQSKLALKDQDAIDFIVTDYPDQFPRGTKIMINYQEWRSEQKWYDAGTVDVHSLRHWILRQLQLESMLPVELPV